jgi:hypothetical protein
MARELSQPTAYPCMLSWPPLDGPEERWQEGDRGGGGGLSLSTWLERTSPAAAALWFPARFVLGPARVLLGKGPVPPCVPAAKCLL